MATIKDNLCAVLYGAKDLRLEYRPIPVPTDNQVLLQMEVVGICGSDVHFYINGRCGPFEIEKPMVIGHEASGTVVEIGKNVKHLKPGDRVAVEPGVPCRRCDYCKTGSYNLCPDVYFCACPPDDGNLSRYYVHDADFCYKLPDNMSFEEGTLVEPLSVGVHACKRASIEFGDVCLITGAGPIGLVTLLAAKAMGALKVVITDVLDVKLDMATKLGADHTIKIDKDMSEEITIKKVVELLGQEPNKSFDCTGIESCIRLCVAATAPKGCAVLIGMGNLNINVPLSKALAKEVDIRGVFRYANDYPTSIQMVQSGKVDVKPLVTHRYTLEESLKAFHTAHTQEGNPIKVLIHANPNWRPS